MFDVQRHSPAFEKDFVFQAQGRRIPASGPPMGSIGLHMMMIVGSGSSGNGKQPGTGVDKDLQK